MMSAGQAAALNHNTPVMGLELYRPPAESVNEWHKVDKVGWGSSPVLRRGHTRASILCNDNPELYRTSSSYRRTVTYQVFDHTADLGLRMRAADLDELFSEAGRALFSVLVANPESIRISAEKQFVLDGDDYEYLLFDFLSELLYTFETEKLLFAEFDVRVEGKGLVANCRGEPLDTGRHRLDHEVKAITYHELKVCRDGDGWLAEVIVDI